ncbi:MAG: serine/threonine protein kinase, partial [Microcoleus sp. T3-bin5]|nr:serine/threonine protein kinase [Microcoleus sp. T3-bin5]
SNILLHSRSGHSVGEVYLVDFGSVQNQAAKFGGTITVVGTYGYMAPEQFGGRSVPASDLYGLGATLIYLVTGLHPAELPQQDLRIQFADRAGQVNPNLIDWLEWMTEPSLGKRLSSAEEALRSLDENSFTINKINKSPLAVRPPESDIILTKKSEFIEILIPPQGVGSSFVALFSAAVVAHSFFIFLGMVGANYFRDLSILVIMLSASLLAAVVLVALLYALCRELRLRIDRQQITHTSNLLGLRWNHSKPARRQDICQLEIKQVGYKVFQMIIQADNQKYRLGVEQRLKESEVEWLATELSQWLGLKIQRTLRDGKKNISR